ncbi:cyanophycinase [Rheinheimera sp. D18]|uniref:cyanophycinase n=1 Tax=Rheinheimera sp. D18 TaxID=2545632 RepID=UPI001FB7A777|nr:cyanophycinase [Rheinheimera sp. D18]
MKILGLYLSAALLACTASAANVKDTKKSPDYTMVLVGGGLNVCSSMHPRNCAEADTFTTAAKSADMFAVLPEQLTSIANNAIWGEERVIEQQQTLAVLEFVRSKVNGDRLTERDLLRLWRSAEIEIDGIWVSGRVNYSALTDRERNFVLDQLQVISTVENSSRRNSANVRQKEYANLAKTKDAFTVEIYHKIIELAQQVAGTQRKPRILVITAAERDPFASVDFYTNLFEEAGAEVSWFPLNAAYQAAQHIEVDNKASCDQLPQYLAAYHGTYQRSRVYPDLAKELEAFCKKGSQAAVEQIRRSDAIFITDGDQSLALQAFRQPDGTATAELKQIEAMLADGNIIVATSNAGTALMAGGRYQGHRTPMITNGDSYNAMQFGAFDLAAPQSGCDKDQSCANGLSENHLTYSAEGGLGLFPWGVLDTQFSERSRQGRLIRLQNDSQTRFGFGIDETTALLVSLGQSDTAAEVTMEVIGAGGVYIVDNEKTLSSGEGAAINLSKINTHYLTRDDKLEIKDGILRTRFAEWKFAPNNNQTPLLYSGDLFERDNYRQLANLLCVTQSQQATAKTVRVGQGYTARLYKDSSSYARQGAFRLNGTELQYCSYRNMILDIQPAN